MSELDLEICPICEWLCLQKTNNCTSTNPIGKCSFTKVMHLHRWCRLGHQWITNPESTTVLQVKKFSEFDNSYP